MMDMQAMGSMMGWMMGLGALAWVIVIGLLVAIVVLLVRLLSKQDKSRDHGAKG